MLIIGIIVALIILVVLPTLRCAVFHPISLTVFGVIDVFNYFYRHQSNLCGAGELVGYTGLFGKGKTLSAVHRIVGSYRRYNGKKVWCPRRRRIVCQRIHVISNVSLSIPYERLESLEQVVSAAKSQRDYDDEHDTLTVTLVLGDEFSVQMNSRNFKKNIDPLFLNTILTCRHYYISLYYTAQRFGHVDALLRQVTSYVIDCDKIWRFQRQRYYDAWDLEQATTPALVRPYRQSTWFVRNRDYDAYDTLECVKNLEHEMKSDGKLSEDEILKLQENQASNMDAVSRPSLRWLRSRRKKS